jgi:hypothetical protein
MPALLCCQQHCHNVECNSLLAGAFEVHANKTTTGVQFTHVLDYCCYGGTAATTAAVQSCHTCVMAFTLLALCMICAGLRTGNKVKVEYLSCLRLHGLKQIRTQDLNRSAYFKKQQYVAAHGPVETRLSLPFSTSVYSLVAARALCSKLW